jgi:hypothetical protein
VVDAEYRVLRGKVLPLAHEAKASGKTLRTMKSCKDKPPVTRTIYVGNFPDVERAEWMRTLQ